MSNVNDIVGKKPVPSESEDPSSPRKGRFFRIQEGFLQHQATLLFLQALQVVLTGIQLGFEISLFQAQRSATLQRLLLLDLRWLSLNNV